VDSGRSINPGNPRNLSPKAKTYFHIFAATMSRDTAQRRLVDDLLALFGGQSRPVVAHLIDAGKLTLDDVEYAENTLKNLRKGREA
jgi:BlaI family transcriptional regulator, penicillinase repressor